MTLEQEAGRRARRSRAGSRAEPGLAGNGAGHRHPDGPPVGRDLQPVPARQGQYLVLRRPERVHVRWRAGTAHPLPRVRLQRGTAAAGSSRPKTATAIPSRKAATTSTSSITWPPAGASRWTATRVAEPPTWPAASRPARPSHCGSCALPLRPVTISSSPCGSTTTGASARTTSTTTAPPACCSLACSPSDTSQLWNLG